MVRCANKFRTSAKSHFANGDGTALGVGEYAARPCSGKDHVARAQLFDLALAIRRGHHCASSKTPQARILWPPQALGLLGGEAPDRGDPARHVVHLHDEIGLVVGLDQLRRDDGQQAALALEADELHVLIGRRDHRAVEACRIEVDVTAQPLGTDARLAEPAPGHVTALDEAIGRDQVGDLAGPRSRRPVTLPQQEGSLPGVHHGRDEWRVHWPQLGRFALWRNGLHLRLKGGESLLKRRL